MVRHTEIRLELSNSKYIDYSILRNNMQLLHKTPKKSRTKFVNVWLFVLPVPVDKPTKGFVIADPDSIRIENDDLITDFYFDDDVDFDECGAYVKQKYDEYLNIRNPLSEKIDDDFLAKLKEKNSAWENFGDLLKHLMQKHQGLVRPKWPGPDIYSTILWYAGAQNIGQRAEIEQFCKFFDLLGLWGKIEVGKQEIWFPKVLPFRYISESKEKPLKKAAWQSWSLLLEEIDSFAEKIKVKNNNKQLDLNNFNLDNKYFEEVTNGRKKRKEPKNANSKIQQVMKAYNWYKNRFTAWFGFTWLIREGQLREDDFMQGKEQWPYKIPGVGEKIWECIRQQGALAEDAFPVDRRIQSLLNALEISKKQMRDTINSIDSSKLSYIETLLWYGNVDFANTDDIKKSLEFWRNFNKYRKSYEKN